MIAHNLCYTAATATTATVAGSMSKAGVPYPCDDRYSDKMEVTITVLSLGGVVVKKYEVQKVNDVTDSAKKESSSYDLTYYQSRRILLSN